MRKHRKAQKAPAATDPIKSTDLRMITAKFNSECAETGLFIRKGDTCYYSSRHRKVVHIESQLAKDAETNADRGLGQMIEAQENAHFDNFVQRDMYF